MSYKIRTALPSDGAALSAIYAPYTETAITYEYPAPTAEEFSARIAAISAHYPFIVCESDGRALGYAYSHRYRERAAYDWDTELSIYFDRAETGRGLGQMCIRDRSWVEGVELLGYTPGCDTIHS